MNGAESAISVYSIAVETDTTEYSVRIHGRIANLISRVVQRINGIFFEGFLSTYSNTHIHIYVRIYVYINIRIDKTLLMNIIEGRNIPK